VWLIAYPAVAQTTPALAGVWTLNRSLSEFPREVGFNLEGFTSPDGDGGSTGSTGGRGRGRGNSRSAPFASRPESYDDARRRQLLIDQIRNPPVRLMIVDGPAAITITNELGQSRTLHPTGKEEALEIQGLPFTATTKRDGDRVVVLYHVEQNRDVQYTFSSSSTAAGPARLVVEVQLLEHGTGDKVTRVYEAGTGAEQPDLARAAAAPAPPYREAPAGQPPPGPPTSAGQTTPGSFDQRPGAEFRGLKNVGILVEDFGPEAIACGLKRDGIEDALAKRLTAGGLTVRKNSDDDTYVYVNVITTSTAGAGCVSRYDAFLYTHATAKLAYHEQPVLAQVSLIHRGGIGASGAAGHASAVTRGLENYIDLFLTQIQDANK
jgi:hypothetical protein